MKTTEKWFKEKLDSFKDDPEFRLERIMLDLTEEICAAMEKKDISRVKLAQLLNVSPAAVTKFLRGTSNFTLKTLLAFGDALDLNLQVKFDSRGAREGVYEVNGDTAVSVATHAQGRTATYSESSISREIFAKPSFDAATVDWQEAA